jgi:Fe-S cluster biogenesis protein NfuA
MDQVTGTSRDGTGPRDALASQTSDLELSARVQDVLDQIRPHVQADGGDIELVDIVNGVVQIRLAGSCVGCMYSMMTLQAGVERMLKERVPEIKAVEAVPL